VLEKTLFFFSVGELQIQFGYLLPDNVLKIYWKHLSKLTIEQWKTSCEQIALSFVPTTACPFPSIAHFWTLRKRNIEILPNKSGPECDDGYIGDGKALVFDNTTATPTDLDL